MSPKFVWFLQTLSERSMVVYFTVDSKNQGGVIVNNRLSTGIYNPLLTQQKKKKGTLPTPTTANRS
jgi:hypothetical protein